MSDTQAVQSSDATAVLDLPDCTVIGEWFDEDHSSDAERIRNDRADAYTVYMSNPSSKGAL